MPAEVIVSPMLVSEVVAKYWVNPVWSWPKGPSDVMPEVIQTPLTAKQPLVRFQPLAAVEVAVEEVMFKRPAWIPPAKVEVAEVLVATKY